MKVGIAPATVGQNSRNGETRAWSPGFMQLRTASIDVYSGQGSSGGGSYGYNRGIRVGNARNGSVLAFIPELEISGFESGVSLGVDQEFIGLHPDGSILVGDVEIG